jgi:hypothetical protein
MMEKGKELKSPKGGEGVRGEPGVPPKFFHILRINKKTRIVNELLLKICLKTKLVLLYSKNIIICLP